jgi:hypothetical protein
MRYIKWRTSVFLVIDDVPGVLIVRRCVRSKYQFENRCASRHIYLTASACHKYKRDGSEDTSSPPPGPQ